MVNHGPAFVVPPRFGQLDNILKDLVHPGVLERHRDAAGTLREFVETELRTENQDRFGGVLDAVTDKIKALSEDNDASHKLAVVFAVDELIDVKSFSESPRTKDFALILISVLQKTLDVRVLQHATEVLGHLVKARGALIADVVSSEIERALALLEAPRERNLAGDIKRQAACLVLKELADNAPAVCNVYVWRFIDLIWAALWDSKQDVREAGVSALAATLCLVEQRETRYRIRGYFNLYERTRKGLSTPAQGGNSTVPVVDSVHGSLLALGVLLEHTHEFMLARYKEVVDVVLKYRSSKEKLIKRVVITLIPKLSRFAPQKFGQTYLNKCTNHLLDVLRHHPTERSVAFQALGEVACALAQAGQVVTMDIYLAAIAQQIKDAITVVPDKRGGRPRPCMEALTCVGVLAEAVGEKWKPHAQARALRCGQELLRRRVLTWLQTLLEPMVLTGLSDTLAHALHRVHHVLPDLAAEVQRLLLELLVLALTPPSAPCIPYNAATSPVLLHQMRAGIGSSDVSNRTELVLLALQVLGDFDFGENILLEFVNSRVLLLLQNLQSHVRQAAAIACCRILQRQSLQLIEQLVRTRLERSGLLKHLAPHCAQLPQPETVLAPPPAAAPEADAAEDAVASANGTLAPLPGALQPLDSASSLRSQQDLPLQPPQQLPGPPLAAPPPPPVPSPAAGSPSMTQSGSPAVSGVFDKGVRPLYGGWQRSREWECFHVLPADFRQKQLHLYESIVKRLLEVAVSDPAVSVRLALLENLNSTRILDRHLAQADLLRALFILLNDEHHKVRVLVIGIAGRLASLNPAYVKPALRRHLLQQLGDLEHSPDSHQQEECAQLLGSLIQSAPDIIRPYTPAIHNALLSKLKDPSPGPGLTAAPFGPLPQPPVSTRAIHLQGPAAAKDKGKKKHGDGFHLSSVLSAFGHLAVVTGQAYLPYVREVVPLIIEAIQDPAVSSARITAVDTLGLVVESTGYVMAPYLEYPQLLGVLLRMLGQGNSAVQQKVVKVLGIVGALDPHTHKLNQASLSGEGRLELEGVRPLRKKTPTMLAADGGEEERLGGGLGGALGGDEGGLLGDGGAAELLPSSGLLTSSEDYYPTVAINTLIKLLRDPSMVGHHGQVIKAMMRIFKTLSLSCVPFLHKTLPALFLVLRNCHQELCKFIIDELCSLVRIVRGHVRKFLPDILQVIDEFWRVKTPEDKLLLVSVLALLGELAASLRDDIREHMPDLLSKFSALFSMVEREGDTSLVQPALQALQALGPALEEYLHMVLVMLLRLVQPASARVIPTRERKSVLLTMQSLLPRMSLANHVSMIVHPLIRVMETDEELRAEAVTTISVLAMAIGPDLAFFMPTLRSILAKYNVHVQPRFERLAARLSRSQRIGITDSADNDTASGWAEDLETLEAQSTNWHAQAMISPDMNTTRPPLMEGHLRRAWENHQRHTKEDWEEWMRNFSVELLKQSPSPALRACSHLAQVHPSMAKELFSAGFVACWLELSKNNQVALVRCLEAALASPNIPPEIVTALLNLAEFMEHDEKALPLDTRTLGALAEKCHAFAKALHYKEMEFHQNPRGAVEALISINTHLGQPEAANGILVWAKANLQDIHLKESWYEKLQRWDKAFQAYTRRRQLEAEQGDLRGEAYWDATMGCMRCLTASAEWDRLSLICREEWTRQDHLRKREMAGIAAHSAWHMGHWVEMETYVDVLRSGPGGAQDSGSEFLRAVLDVRLGKPEQALDHMAKARELLSTELAALVGESYERAYGDMVRVQQLTELEEVVKYQQADAAAGGDAAAAAAKRQQMREMWAARLRGVQRNVEAWQALLSVRSLVVDMHEDQDTWLKFSSLCFKHGHGQQGLRTLHLLLGFNPETVQEGMPGYGAGSGSPTVMLAWLKYQWGLADNNRKPDLLKRLGSLIRELESEGNDDSHQAGVGRTSSTLISSPASCSTPGAFTLNNTFSFAADQCRPSLRAKANLYAGLWRWSTMPSLDDQGIEEVMVHMHAATQLSDQWGKAWHAYGMFNIRAMRHFAENDPTQMEKFVVPAAKALFRSIALGQKDTRDGKNLQDILRLLTLWFHHGLAQGMRDALQEGFSMVSIETWLCVIPQVMARIHTQSLDVKEYIHELLVSIGNQHPQALMYPLLVACKSQSRGRREAAEAVLRQIRSHSAALVEQAQLVSKELIRIAILWHEMWHEALEDASRMYFGDSNVQGMLDVLLPLHRLIDKDGSPETLKEVTFIQQHGQELKEAHDWLQRYQQSKREAELHQAWDLYYHVFKRINKELQQLTMLDLQYVAPALVRAQSLELAVPGTYIIGEPLVTIHAFAQTLTLISSKQRPRKLTILGSDGAEYMFLLKGHEDLRQDERVMQLFGLVNSMLAHDRITAERDLSIARYAVIPLAPNSGLIGWVPNTDTLHALIREYREVRKIPINTEHRLMLGMAPDYDLLNVIQKVEVFEYALDSTPGDDLHKVLWLKSRNSEVWLDRRTNYTRSLAVMSMVGYILGLGDRHPSNLMLDRYSGKLLHIDFGDCFEASMHRDKFPEKVPFRLTRMMVKAMEVSGIEGNFRTTCENVMRVMRIPSNRESVIAMLEAFVHDPLVNWRLLGEGPKDAAFLQEREGAGALRSGAEASTTRGQLATGSSGQPEAAAELVKPGREAREKEQMAAYKMAGRVDEVLNERAVAVMSRMSDKLLGKDHALPGLGASGSQQKQDSVEEQVQRVVVQATSHENLCQSYIGWCPFW